MKNITSILLIAGILVLLNLLSNQFFFRLDLSENQVYTLSKATRNILKSVRDAGTPVTVTAYFSKNLPPVLTENERDFRNMLVEFANRSKGYVDFQFVSPETDEEKQEAAQKQIQPLMVNIREKDQSKQQQVFMGATVQMGEESDVIPVVQPGPGMEYALATSIKKLSVKEKPSIAFVQGQGEPALQELSQAYKALSILYQVETVTLDEAVPDRFKTIAIVAPADTFTDVHLAQLDQFLARGGNLLVAYNAVNGDLNNAVGVPVTTRLESWLTGKGVTVSPSFIIDSQCGSVSVQQRNGFFTINTPVQFPYLPLVSNFADHPITGGLEQMIFPFASPVQFSGDSSKTFTPLIWSSTQAGIVNTPVNFDINKPWTTQDFPLSNVVMGGILQGNFGGTVPARIVIYGDGDFGVSGQQARGGETPDNINLLVNSIDWLSDDTGLIDLRTKEVASRPLKAEIMSDDAAGKRTFIKLANLLAPITLVILIGLFFSQRQRTIRLRRAAERLD